MHERSKHVLMVMRQILRATDNYARALARQTGLTASQLLLLQVLDQHGESTAGEIAAHMGITQATTTNLLHKLEDRGLVSRRRSDTDRRKVWLTLTEAGREKLMAAPDDLQERFSHQFEALEDWEQSMIIAALERISAMMGAADIEAAPLLDAGALDREHPRT